jgi:hypothetical protein
MIKGSFIKEVVPLMDENLNPEKQLRTSLHPRGICVSKYTYGIYVKDSNERTVLDIGRNWMETSKYKKHTGFMKWEKK